MLATGAVVVAEGAMVAAAGVGAVVPAPLLTGKVLADSLLSSDDFEPFKLALLPLLVEDELLCLVPRTTPMAINAATRAATPTAAAHLYLRESESAAESEP